MRKFVKENMEDILLDGIKVGVISSGNEVTLMGEYRSADTLDRVINELKKDLVIKYNKYEKE